ncbi:ribosome modulation factor [Rubellimicrobium aerolatum]|uniref:Ribosome modulation factor n=1 Tax=Rubellimicrobium aerolatum TaxID=490979 RepID=A0ABW0SEC9_9RHOB|nr:hypothetical protein [Rubellimicrobium aerolatum]MBP1805627.1 ribosome modulation factor [Rubellimicrobium aerolatum]
MAEDSSESAGRAGYEAGLRRQALLSNPYPAGTEAFRTWQAGWREAEGTPRPGDAPPAVETS